MALEIAPRITVDPAVRHGQPVIQGTRVPVSLLIGPLASGLTPEEVASEYGPSLLDIRAALQCAAELMDDETVSARA